MEKKETNICSTDDHALAQTLLAPLKIESCSFFEVCNHRMFLYPRNDISGIEVFTCAIDWIKVGPALGVLILALVMFYWKNMNWKRQRQHLYYSR
jgi:hypothetical protein